MSKAVARMTALLTHAAGRAAAAAAIYIVCAGAVTVARPVVATAGLAVVCAIAVWIGA